MIHPSASEVLATVLSTFSREIVPDLTSVEARSSAATIEHLLRHVLLRVEAEGDLLMRDIYRLRALLGDIAASLERGSNLLATSLQDVLAVEPVDLWTLARQGDEALRLRSALVSVQKALGAAPGEIPEETVSRMKASIGAYISAQLADEAQLIVPAFAGKGPRR